MMLTAIQRAIKYITEAHDLRHPNNRDAKPDLEVLVQFCRKAQAALVWTHKASCECGKIENESGICPVCEALAVVKTP